MSISDKTKWSELTAGEGLFVGILAVIMFAILMAWNGAITYLGWKWFITPFGVPQISLLYALGLGTYVAWFSGPNHGKVTKEESRDWLWTDIKRDVSILTVMWIVHFFV